MKTKDIQIGEYYGFADSKHFWRYRKVKVLEIKTDRTEAKYISMQYKTSRIIRVQFMGGNGEHVRWVRPHDIRMPWEDAQAENEKWDFERQKRERDKKERMTEGEEVIKRLTAALSGLDLGLVHMSNRVYDKYRVELYLTPEDAVQLAVTLENIKGETP